MSGYALLELAVRRYVLPDGTEADYILSLVRDDDVFQVACLNVTEDRFVFLCGEREKFVTTDEDDALHFFRQVSRVRARA